ncbi:MAG: hypothetical protein HKO59_14245 [Phycisphaerales bacterium]|nr:hypothetical protein [Phycisphaerae bacterium]NNF42153.1 hypothetical protein [Phycisphaerales bacterium]NNM27120.1 hypothetical protein [Phycisphaerales bacterium]
MALFVDERKIKAACSSMHQFIPAVKRIFPGEVQPHLLESALVYMYLSVAREIFSRRFVERLDAGIRNGLRFNTPAEAHRRVAWITARVDTLLTTEDPLLFPGATISPYEHGVRCIVRTFLDEGGFSSEDSELVRDTFLPTDEALTALRRHMSGIKKQNPYLFR